MNDLASAEARWARACLAAHILAVDPAGLAGIRVTGLASPARAEWIRLLEAVPLTQRRIPPSVGDDVLYGGFDLCSLGGQAKIQKTAGVLDQPSLLVVPSAERCPPDLAGKLGLALEGETGHCLVALEEQADPEETIPAALAERLSFHIWLDGIAHAAAQSPPMPDIEAARSLLPHVSSQDAVRYLVDVAATLGIRSLRAPWFACRAARAHAALAGRAKVLQQDLDLAVMLVLVPRAEQLPETEQPPPDQQPEDEPRPENSGSRSDTDLPNDMLIDAVKAVLPDGVLPPGMAAKAGAAGAGAGARKRGNRRGRPVPSRPGRPDGRSRIDVVATLRAAVPYQTLRARAPQSPSRIALRAQDLRLKRFETFSDRLIIFAVDASGSQALTRLGEAKGAVELLLSRAYASRDQAALVAFRGADSELLLSPTRSLLQAKRCLAALPGGGGTPLAAGLRDAGKIALSAQKHGLSPLLVVLTDGKANVGLDGQTGRAQAQTDAKAMAAWLCRSHVDTVVLDTGPRAQPALAELARIMGARLMALPYANAHSMSAALEHVVTS